MRTLDLKRVTQMVGRRSKWKRYLTILANNSRAFVARFDLAPVFDAWHRPISEFEPNLILSASYVKYNIAASFPII